MTYKRRLLCWSCQTDRSYLIARACWRVLAWTWWIR